MKFWEAGEEITADKLNDSGFGLRVLAQSTPGMTLQVKAGVVMVQGVFVKYAGGNSGSFSAPSGNPRIDLLCINSSGALSIVAGTEAGSPAAPTYPSDKYVLAEIYIPVGATSIKNEDDSSNGYIYRDARPQILLDPSKYFDTFLAGEAITAMDPVRIGAYQSGGAAAYDNSAQGTFGTSLSTSFTVAANSNRMLIVSIAEYNSGSGSVVSAVSYGGQSLTLISRDNDATGSGSVSTWYLINPPSGSNTLAATASGNDHVYGVHSFYNCAQSAPTGYASSAANSGTSSHALTPSTAGSLLFFATNSQGSPASFSNPSNISNAKTGNSNQANLYAGWTGPINSPASTTQSVDHGSTFHVEGQFEILCANAVVPAIFRANASDTTHANAFIGFAPSAISQDASGIVVMGGTLSGFTGLSIGSQYYLANSSGAIQTSAGTTTRKVGIAVASTKLVITNVW